MTSKSKTLAGLAAVGAVTVLFFVVQAATVTIDNIPGAAVANLQDQCELLRISLDRSPADWADGADPLSNCGLEFIRRGARSFTRETSHDLAQLIAVDAVVTDLVAFDLAFPKPVGAFCGNGTVDFFDLHIEICDDGAETADCDADCTPVECGDNEQNVAAGEECDDGNTDTGDGCDASCQLE